MAIVLNGTTGITSPKVNALDLELNSVNVVERGSNANGDYVRFADGTQICTQRIVMTADASRYFSSWTFPAVFSDSLYSAHVAANMVSTSWSVVADRSKVGVVGMWNETQSSVSLAFEEIVGQSISVGATVSGCPVVAIGRWF